VVAWVLTFTTLVLNGAAQLLLRSAALRGADPTRPSSLVTSPAFMAGLIAYGISVLTWLGALKRLPLSVATPFVALVYVLVPIAARIVFGDVLNWRMASGMGLIVIGVLVVAQR
jgi:drug/metabolite transporter (DMT)-like permease